MSHFSSFKRSTQTFFSLALVVLPLAAAQAQLVNTYSAVASSSPYAALPATATSPTVSGTLDEGFYNALPIGFTFRFDGVNYTTVSASTNGWMTFGQNITNPTPANNLTSGTPRPLVAPLWDDISFIYVGTGTPTGNNGKLSYLTTGTAPNRTFTVEWADARWAPVATGPVQSFQVQLDEGTNVVRFAYVQGSGTVSGTRSASVGLAGVAANNFFSLSSLSDAATFSTTTETAGINSRASSNRVFTFTPGGAMSTKKGAGLNALSIVPNPASRQVQVLGAAKGYPLQLLDLQGRVVREQPTGATALDLSHVAAGMYLVRSGSQQGRVIVE